ncbi:TetR/AcrR family transcriptional regulator [Nocardioides stalactiti]|uniref:TetR/AcrR family transcriptional regulator n=1 Tax=Nocardioides stalactiti TaxID=2755356 RepID=UPI0015FFE00E|nr:TetR/AcrR family transcriptional regulator [Nocardioides stalactiti]
METSDTKAARTRRRILDVAAQELAEHGYGGASLRRTAAAADLKVGSLYFHFQTKDDLVAATLVDGVESARTGLLAAIEAVPHDAPPTERLRAAVVGHLDTLHASDARAASVVRMVETLPPDLRAAHVTHERRFARVWLDELQRGQAAGVVRTDIPVRVLRDLLVGALNSTSTTSPAANKRLDDIADAALRLLAPVSPSA